MATEKRIVVSAEEFVAAYLACSSIDELSETTGLTKGSCSSRITNLKKKGVKLPQKFTRAKKEVDVDGLNALIEAANKPKGKK